MIKINMLDTIEDFLYVIKNKLIKSRTPEYSRFRRRMQKLYGISSWTDFLIKYDLSATTGKSRIKRMSKQAFFCLLPKIAFNKQKFIYPGEFIILHWASIENDRGFVTIPDCPSNINDVISFLKLYGFSSNEMTKKIKQWSMLNLGLTLGDFYDIFIVPQYPLKAVVKVINGKTDMSNS